MYTLGITILDQTLSPPLNLSFLPLPLSLPPQHPMYCPGQTCEKGQKKKKTKRIICINKLIPPLAQLDSPKSSVLTSKLSTLPWVIGLGCLGL